MALTVTETRKVTEGNVEGEDWVLFGLTPFTSFLDFQVEMVCKQLDVCIWCSGEVKLEMKMWKFFSL